MRARSVAPPAGGVFHICPGLRYPICMKVVRHTPDQLIVANVPWLIGILISLFILVFAGAGLFMLSQGIGSGLVFLLGGGGLGLGAFAAFVRRVQVIFDRPGDSITIRRRSVFGYTQDRYPLSGLVRAELEETRSEGTRVFRPVLVLGDRGGARRVPVVLSYTSTAGPQRIVDAVNAWLGAAAPGAQGALDSAPQSP